MENWKNQFLNLFNEKGLESLIKSLDTQVEQSLKNFDKQLKHFHSNYFFDIEATETDKEFVFRASLPVNEQDRIKLDIVNQQLRILIQCFEAEHLQNEQGETLRKENYSKRIERYLPLPPSVSREHIKATMSGNILTIKIPKQQTNPSQVIDIDCE